MRFSTMCSCAWYHYDHYIHSESLIARVCFVIGLPVMAVCIAWSHSKTLMLVTCCLIRPRWKRPTLSAAYATNSCNWHPEIGNYFCPLLKHLLAIESGKWMHSNGNRVGMSESNRVSSSSIWTWWGSAIGVYVNFVRMFMTANSIRSLTP